ncbi:hypothetical protein M408DRAFT_77699 [Serendipita vermifera MAFF 305830]|uniref:Spindle pole body component n=1 Tax=Serendipita vermifera MAFF 305830 TaxID=933852 RepID=A0A0C2X1L8_SERVB|nr:hypothetical protein M408DRAFT_77699 [Serendipita vermifera MAFF 305830]
MSNDIFTTLPPIDYTHTSKSNLLEPIHAAFFVPKLENRPQNPIIDSLGLNSSRNTYPLSVNGHVAVKQIPAIGTDPISKLPKSNGTGLVTNEEGKGGENIWLIAASGSDAQGNKLKTWDGLRSTYPKDATEGDLLSEQHPSVFAGAQEFVIPHVRTPNMTRWYLQPAELLEVLMTNLIGHSSRLYEWDSVTESFRKAAPHASQIIIAYGFSEDMSRDIIRQHLGIGTCLRRLDDFILRLRSTTLHSTMLAFLHSLETIVATLRKQLQRHKPVSNTVLSQLWLHYADLETTLTALTEFCNVGESSVPPYKPLPTEAAAFLSHLYACVELHFQSHSPRNVRSALAYLLSTSSGPFFRKVEQSIGIGKAPLPDTTQFEGNEDGLLNANAHALNAFSPPESYPDFFSDEQKAQTSVAARSLKVLAAAEPSHPLLNEYADRRCQWVWHEDELERMFTGQYDERGFQELRLPASSSQLDVLARDHPARYPPELASFKAFDMEPGSQWDATRTSATSLPIDTRPYQAFLAVFPEHLPLSTPTLSHLANAVLHPLQLQSNRLTNALLSLFLSPPLSLPSHLSLLHSFALLGSQSFTYRLRGALFTESDGYQPVGRGTRARTRAKLGIKDARDVAAEAEEIGGPEGVASAAKWGIGLGLGLSERGVWPPGGAELGFALRRVIVDTLDEMVDPDAESDESLFHKKGLPCGTVVKEAEWRLGFAIRDLPVDEGREEWLNPSSVAALDFLYLDYKPPLPVAALITPEILSKYQRIFNFLLRLLRVETVSRGLFNSILKGPPLFTQTPHALGLLRRFRFHAHGFVSTLITYIFDTAIGIHLEGFTSRIKDIATRHNSRTSQSSSRATDEEVNQDKISLAQVFVDDDGIPVADIFEIMTDHSLVLDKILGGCVLRTQQRAISEVLEDLMTIVLRLGSLVRDLKRGALTDDDASSQLEKLHYNFERKMFTLTKVLRAMDDKSELRSLLSALATSDRDYEVLSRNAGGPKREIGLSDLLARLDPGEWWKLEMERRVKAKREKQTHAPA